MSWSYGGDPAPAPATPAPAADPSGGWTFPNGSAGWKPEPKADNVPASGGAAPGLAGAALLSNATSTADRLLAGGDAGGDLADLLAAAKKALGETPGAAPAEADFEPDPDAGKPTGVTSDQFAIAI